MDLAYRAARIGLQEDGFKIRRANRSEGYVIGEHGMTIVDWNVVVCGVYLPSKTTDATPR